MDEQLGTMINMQPAPQATPDPNAASLVSPQQPMHADQAAAALAYATNMSDHFLTNGQGIQKQQEQPIDGSTEPKTAPGDTETPKENKDESGMEERLMKQIDTLKEQITSNRQQDELGKIREELTALLNENEG